MEEWWQRLQAVARLHPRERWQALVELQQAVKEERSVESEAVLKEIAGEFERLKGQRKEFNEESVRAYEKILGRIAYLGLETISVPEGLLPTIFTSYQGLQEDIAKADLLKEHRKSLQERLRQAVFDPWSEKKRGIDERLRRIPFSSWNFPDVEDHGRMPRLRNEGPIGLESVLNAHQDIFGKGKTHEFRAQQAQYLLAIHEAVQRKMDIVIEGPTGLGKTKALLTAITPFLQEHSSNKVVYATRTLSQVFNISKEIKEVKAAGGGTAIKAAIHIGTEALRDAYAQCYEKIDDWTEANRRRVEADKEPFTTASCNGGCKGIQYRFGPGRQELDLDAVGLEDLVASKRQCPIGLMKRSAEQANLIIIPHNYLHDEEWKALFCPEKENAVVILDEGHNFVHDAGNNPFLTLSRHRPQDRGAPDNRISNSYAVEDFARGVRERALAGKPLSTYIDGEIFDIGHLIGSLANAYDEFDRTVRKIFASSKEVSTLSGSALFELYEQLPEGFIGNLGRLESLLRRTVQEMTFDGKLADGATASVHSALQLAERLKTTLSEPYEFTLTLLDEGYRFNNLHPRQVVQRAIGGFRSAVVTSATISPVEDVAELCGFDHALTSRIGHIFPAKNYEHFFVSGANSSRKDDLKTVFSPAEGRIVQDVLAKALGAAGGKNVGVFCSSNNGAEEVYHLLRRAASHVTILGYVQDDDHENLSQDLEVGFHQAFTRLGSKAHSRVPVGLQDQLAFTEDYQLDNVIKLYKSLGYLDETAVLLGVAGGALAEGVDYPGRQMEMVIAVGLPYPSSAAELSFNKAKEDYFFMQKGDRRIGEDLSYRQDAFRKVAQTVGRSHRRMDDRGVIIFLDERLLGVKNVRSEGDGRYEFLSLSNAQRNLDLLQAPLRKVEENIVLGGIDKNENRQLMQYIKRGFPTAGFITSERMAERIGSFYRGAP